MVWPSYIDRDELLVCQCATRLTLEDMAQVVAYADTHGVSLSRSVRELLRRGLRHAAPEGQPADAALTQEVARAID